MKRGIVQVILALVVISAFAQQGWRAGEMEVKVQLHSVAEGDLLRTLNFQSEIASPDGTIINVYLTPSELAKLEASGLKYKVAIPDLNEHYRNFWNEKLVPSGYYTYQQIVDIADSLATNFPYICKKVMYGTSIGGRQLAALKISDNVDNDENEPEIMFDGGIHGDEVGGPQNLIMFARDLCLGFNSNTTYTNLINTREIWLYYMVNPDGRVNMSRFNDYGVDCNRDAGYMWDNSGNSYAAFSQPETRGVRDCIIENQFVVYINYHSGAEMICYPWSYRAAATPDNPNMNQMANYYEAASGYPYLIYGQGYQILYQINGSFKDFDYGGFSGIGWTIELSNDKQPLAYQIPIYYNYNLPAMVEVIDKAGYGLEGVVTDSLTGEPIPAIIWVNNYYPVYNDPVVGDYHKFVLPNTYTIRVTANGYKPKTLYNVAVPSTGSTMANFQLVPDNLPNYAFTVLSCRVPGNNASDPAFTPGLIGSPDGVAYALGKSGWIVFGMSDTIYNIAGKDVKVIESGGLNRKYNLFASTTMDGPWLLLGTGTGTSEFDIATQSFTKVKYFKIVDDGDGASTGLGVGFNLDAVEMLCNFNLNLGNDTILALASDITLDAGNPGCTYLWSTGDTTQTITVDSTGIGQGTATFSVVVTKTPNCSTSDEISVTFDNLSFLSTNKPEKSVILYPNPSAGKVEMQTNGLKGARYKITSPLGIEIHHGKISMEEFKEVLEFGGDAKGVYLVEIIDNETHITKKLIIN